MAHRQLGLEAYSRPYDSHASPSVGASSPAMSYATNSTTASFPSPRPNQTARVTTKVKLCCVGDGGVGKTCLLTVYAEERFPTSYIPTVFETYVTRKQIGDKAVEFALWDTAGQEEYDRLRPLSYPETSVLLVCFAVDYPPSLENVEERWWPEVAHFCEGVPVILVATKTDLRRDTRARELLKAQGREPITAAEGQALARRMGAQYAEVSAMTGLGVQEVFELALREGLKRQGSGKFGGAREGRERKTPKCTIL